MRVPSANGNPVSWGLNDLDAIVGPMVLGRLYLVGARPSNGKTAFAVNFINRHMERLDRMRDDEYLSTPRKIQVFLTERTPDVALRAWGAMRAGLDEDAVLCEEWETLPPGSEERFGQELQRIRGWWDDSRVLFTDASRPTCSDIVQMVDEWNPDIVVFDHIQRVKPEGRQNRFDSISEAAHMFQTLATQGNRIVLVMSQLKRRGDGALDKYRPPHLEDFKLSGEIEEDADVALGLFRPLQGMTNGDFREVREGRLDLERFKVPDTMTIKVLKHRYRGKAADRMVKVRIASGRIDDMTRVPF